MVRVKQPTAKEVQFCLEYLKDFNSTRAAVAAGYSERSAKQMGYKLIRRPAIAEFLRVTQEARAKKADIDAGQVLGELKLVAASDIVDVAAQLFGEDLAKKIAAIPEKARRAIASVKLTKDGGIEFRFWPKVEALDRLARHLNLFEKDDSGSKNGDVSVTVYVPDNGRSDPNKPPTAAWPAGSVPVKRR